jgi:Fe2+ transport system protein FeoA
MKTSGIPLHLAAKGSTLIIVDIPDGKNRARLIRLGILKGERIRCLEVLPGGTVVIEKNRQEIAIGVSLARLIVVASTSPDHLGHHGAKK